MSKRSGLPRRLELRPAHWDDLYRLAVWQESVPGWLDLPEEAWDSIGEYIGDSLDGLLPEDACVFDVETARGGRLVAIAHGPEGDERRVGLIRRPVTKGKRR